MKASRGRFSQTREIAARVGAAGLFVGLTTSFANPAIAATAPGSRMVEFHGYRVEVPADWPVIDLTRNPRACVRYDRHAVYLGHPSPDQVCPARLVGRTDALLIEPLDAQASPRVGAHTARTGPGRATPAEPPPSRAGEITVAVTDAGVLVTAAHGPDERLVRSILASATLTGRARAGDAETAPTAGASAAATAVVVPGTYLGKGFDACTAPSSSQMQAWLSSPYRSIGVYIGGVHRACAQPNLTAAWVSEQVAEGWHLVPTYVGLQAPCTSFTYRVSTDPATARQQGRDAASDAVSKAQALGIAENSVLYNDMEAYDSSNSTCKTAVLNFLTGWTERLHELDYRSGVYSSAGSGIRDLASVYGSTTYARPDHIWFAWWNGVADTDGGSYVPDNYWPNHERIHQYQGGHNETYGGVTLNIDSNYVDVAPPVTLDFAAYPLLQYGATGAEVKAAQYLLNEHGYNAGAVDGVFGTQTENAVKSFQTAKGLASDGVIGRQTWTALLSAGYRPFLQMGSTGHDVRRLQRALTAALGRTVTVDGVFGTATDQAVRDYQSTRGLTVDGKVGAETWTALQSGR